MNDHLGEASANRRRELEATRKRPPAGVTAANVGQMVAALDEDGQMEDVGLSGGAAVAADESAGILP